MNENDTRTQLLDAAQELVQRVGANAMSYQHLSDALGIRKASIHYYFPAKSDLLVALIERYQAFFLGVVAQIATGRGTGAGKLREYCRVFERTLSQAGGDRACPCGMLGAEIASLEPKAAQALRSFYRANAAALAKVLDQGRDDGSLQFEGSAETLAWLIFSHLEGAMLVARVDGGAARFRSQLRQLEALLKAGR